jgi:HAD superfamily hydrolase (TIGR01662 family)
VGTSEAWRGAGEAHQVLFDVVVPTVGRASLRAVLDGVAAGPGPWPGSVIVVDDRRGGRPLELEAPDRLGALLTVTRSGGRGPAAARNVGWLASGAPWVAFLDDDVVPPPGWRAALATDLNGLVADVGASKGRITVPMPSDRRPTDWERQVAGLASARWVSADLAVRRRALERLGGFDERFRRAYREDADLAVRLRANGYRLVEGTRHVVHPVRPAPWSISIRRQVGNADDALMRRKHGRRWRHAAETGSGRIWHHTVTTTCLAIGAVASAYGGSRRFGRLLLAVGAADLASFGWQRMRPGPRTAAEIAAMAATSAVIPPLACAQRVRGWARVRRMTPRRPLAVLFDRDGTLVRDVPYNGDPLRVEPMPGARAALDRLRWDGVPMGVISNQSGVARGLLRASDVDAVNARVDELLGPIDVWRVCQHGDGDRCGCRKPAPGLVHEAAAQLAVPVERCVVVGDIGSDVEAARRAGALGILVPTATTQRSEVAAAARVAKDLGHAVDLLIELTR